VEKAYRTLFGKRDICGDLGIDLEIQLKSILKKL
jgi:hypothetical protein